MTPTRPADPARLSPIPYLTVSLSCPSVIYGLLGALLGLTVAGLLLWFDRLLPADWSEIRFLHDTLELLAAALMAAAGAELWENGRRLPLVWRSAAEITRVAAPSPVKILAAGLGQGLLLIWAVRLAPLGDWYITGPLALGVGAVALSKLAETRRRWRQLRQLRQAARPDAHALPPRQPARRSLRFTTNSSLNLLIRLLILGAMLAALVASLHAGELREKLWPLALLLMMIGDSARARVWRWQRWRYDAQRDSFHHDRRRWFHWQEERSWPAAEFCGLYLDTDDDYPQLWLAGRAGGADVPLLTLAYWLRPNDRDARALAEKLSRASGLPLLYRWPGPPAEILAPALRPLSCPPEPRYFYKLLFFKPLENPMTSTRPANPRRLFCVPPPRVARWHRWLRPASRLMTWAGPPLLYLWLPHYHWIVPSIALLLLAWVLSSWALLVDPPPSPRRPALPLAKLLPPRAAKRHSLHAVGPRNRLGLLYLFAAVLLLLAMAWSNIQRDQWPALVITGLGLLALGRLGAQVWWWWQWGYDKDQDVFYRHRRPCFGGRLRREEWPAADFCALYWEPLDYSDRIYVPNRVWLAGRAGGEDVLLADFDEAHVLAERLAEASGLPLRHRWPPAPDPITRL